MGFSLSDLNPVNVVKNTVKAVGSVASTVVDAGEKAVDTVVDAGESAVDKVSDTLSSIPGKASSLGLDAYGTLNRIFTPGNGVLFASSLSDGKRKELMTAAANPARADQAFDGGSTRDLYNKHRTNTPAEMLEGLKGDYTCLEGDVRVEKGLFGTDLGDKKAIMSHDDGATDGMTLKDWMTIGKESGRMIKMDFKETAALPEAMKNAKDLHIDDKKLMFNGGMGLDFTKIRAEFPNATLAINPAKTDAAGLKEATDKAAEVGKPVIFPIRRDLVTPELVETLKPFGEVAVWGPANAGETPETAKDALRKIGVDGMIDVEEHKD